MKGAIEMNEQVMISLLEKYEKAKSDYTEIIHRAENKRTGGQVIRAEERFKCLEEVCEYLGIRK